MFRLLIVLFFAFFQNEACADVINVKCNFPVYSSKDGFNNEQQFALHFIIDGEHSYVIGNNGTSRVSLISGDGGFTFLEVTNSGNVMTTTVSKLGESVHSRHTVISQELVASQSYGKCVKS